MTAFDCRTRGRRNGENMSETLKFTLLAVDDTKMNRNLISRIFKEKYNVLTAENGVAAMEALTRENIDVIVLDILMPEMDGFEVIQAVRADERLKRIPIIITTAERGQFERKALQMGADDFITKPFDPVVVAKRVDNITRRYALEMGKMPAGVRMVCGDLAKSGAADEADRLFTEHPDPMENGLFGPFLQPCVDIASGDVLGAEALARRLCGESTARLPDSFIPALEKRGLTAKLDRLMLESVCGLLESRRQSGLFETSVSVNLSTASVLDLRLPDEIDELKARFGIKNGELEFELSERVFGTCRFYSC